MTLKGSARNIVEADDLHIAPFREDGKTYGTSTGIGSEAVGGVVYLRVWADNSRNFRWYQAALWQKAGRITAAGMTKEVSFEPVEGPIHDRIDDADRATYKGDQHLPLMITARRRAATVKVLPKEVLP